VAEKPTTGQWDLSARVRATMARLKAGTTASEHTSPSQHPTQGALCRIRVLNNATPPATRAISIVPDNGPRTLLRVVPPSETEVLECDLGRSAGPFRLIAESTDGTATMSPRFFKPGDDPVEWNLRQNRICVTGEQ
jgi:hypothetical protein